MDTPPAATNQPWDTKQWIKDYGVVAAAAAIVAVLLGLGLPGLYRLGEMNARIKSLEDTIKEEMRPDIKSIRAVLEAKNGVWVLLAETRTKLDSIEKNALELNARIQLMDTRTQDAFVNLNKQIIDLWKGRTP